MSRKRSKWSADDGSENTVTDRTALPTRYMEMDPDVELCFDDKIVPGHSQLLGLWSKVLKDAINAGSGQGASTTDKTQLRIPMNGTSSSDWLKVMPFIYPGDEAEVTWDNLEALLVLGDKFDMPDLASRASKFLNAHQAELNSNNQDSKYIWKWILLLDHAAGNKSLCESCIQRVATQFRSTCNRENIKGLSREVMEMLTVALAENDPPQKVCPSCRRQGIDMGSARLANHRYYCSACHFYFG
jgi:hypothetical protein